MKIFIQVAHPLVLIGIAACAVGCSKTESKTSSATKSGTAVPTVGVQTASAFAPTSPPEHYKPLTSVRSGTKTYYVDVVQKGPSATVWLRNSATVVDSKKDVKTLTMTFSTINASELPKVLKTVCVVKDAHDKVEGVIGCTAVAGSVACVPAIEITAGAALPFCEAVWEYAATKGAADCVKMVADAIADSAPVGNAQKQAAKTATNATVTTNTKSWNKKSIISATVDAVCYAATGGNGTIDGTYFSANPQLVPLPGPLPFGPLPTKPPVATATPAPAPTPAPATSGRSNGRDGNGHEYGTGRESGKSSSSEGRGGHIEISHGSRP